MVSLNGGSFLKLSLFNYRFGISRQAKLKGILFLPGPRNYSTPALTGGSIDSALPVSAPQAPQGSAFKR
jgi:hypothetical protein